ERRMYARAIVSTPDRDRVGDEVRPEGCNLSHYRMHPLWFFNHQLIPFPVGTAEDPSTGQLDVRIVPGAHVEAGCFFYSATKEAVQVFDLVAKVKAIRGTSIAFNPLSEPIRLSLRPGALIAGLRYDEWELIEISWVGVPCNPYATVVREYLDRDRSANGERIAPLVRKALLPLASPRRAWFGWSSSMKKQDGGLSSTSGPQGGYTVPGEQMPEGMPAEQAPTVKAIRKVMHRHKGDAHPDGPHD